MYSAAPARSAPGSSAGIRRSTTASTVRHLVFVQPDRHQFKQGRRGKATVTSAAESSSGLSGRPGSGARGRPDPMVVRSASPRDLYTRIRPRLDRSLDLIAGLTLLVIAVPEQFATSRFAGMPAATALWAFVAATVAFFLLGSTRSSPSGPTPRSRRFLPRRSPTSQSPDRRRRSLSHRSPLSLLAG